jgi:hypothetical protein
MDNKVSARPDGPGSRPSDSGPSRVLTSLQWESFRQRLQVFADRYCRRAPSLGMVGEMLWVFDLDFDFRLLPRDPNASKPIAEPIDREPLNG